MQHWGKSGKGFNNDRQDIMPRLSDRQTVYSKQTADSQTAAEIQTTQQSAVIPVQEAIMESRLREG